MTYELEEHGSVTLFAVGWKDSITYASQLWNQLHLGEALPDLKTDGYALWENDKDEYYYFLNEQTATTDGWIITATSVETVTKSLNDLLLILLAGVPAAILLALWAGYFWA